MKTNQTKTMLNTQHNKNNHSVTQKVVPTWETTLLRDQNFRRELEQAIREVNSKKTVYLDVSSL